MPVQFTGIQDVFAFLYKKEDLVSQLLGVNKLEADGRCAPFNYLPIKFHVKDFIQTH